MGTEYTRSKDDQADPNTSPAEETVELLLMTAGEPTGPVTFAWEEEPRTT